MIREFNTFKSVLEEISTHLKLHNSNDTYLRCETCINYIGLLKQQLYCLQVNLVETKDKNLAFKQLIDIIDNYRVLILQEDFKQNSEVHLVKVYEKIVRNLQIELDNLKIFNNYGLLSYKLNGNELGKISVENNNKKRAGYRGHEESLKNYSNYSQ